MSTSNAIKEFDFLGLTSPWDVDAQQEWAVDDFIPSQAVTMISGESGSGKSTVTLMLAHAIVKGEPFLGHPTRQSKVLIIDRENGAAIYKERFKRLKLDRNDDIHYWGGWQDPLPQGPKFAPLLKFAKEHKPVIIFDSFIAFLDEGSEQDATEVRRYMDAYRFLALAGATVVFIHHTGKGENTKDYRGSSDIKGSVDMAWVLTAKKYMTTAKLRNIKSREGMVEDISFFLEDANFVLTDTHFIPATDPDWAVVHDAVAKHPDLNQSQITSLIPQVADKRVRKILLAGQQKGTLSVIKGPKNASLYRTNNWKGVQI